MARKIYLTEDLLVNISFQKYCLGSEQMHVNFWDNWIKQNPDNLSEVQQAKSLFHVLTGNHSPGVFNSDRASFLKVIEDYFGSSKLQRETSELCDESNISPDNRLKDNKIS